MSFLGMDPPEHTRVRALVNRGFSPRRVSQLADREMGAHIVECAGTLKPSAYHLLHLPAEASPRVVAEREGFEPSVGLTTHAFQACALNRSATSPTMREK